MCFSNNILGQLTASFLKSTNTNIRWAIPFFNHTGGLDVLFRVDIFLRKSWLTQVFHALWMEWDSNTQPFACQVVVLLN